MSYIGNSPGVASQRVVTTFTATAGQTTFTPTSGYTIGYCDVYLNGVRLVNADDYTASNGTSVVLSSGAAAGDTVEIVAFIPRGLSDGYLKAEADSRFVNVTGDTMSGNLQFNKDLPEIRLRSATEVNKWYIGANISDVVDGGIHIGRGDNIGSGSRKLIIDSAGRVVLPYQPAFRARASAVGDFAISPNTIVPFRNTPAFNVGNHFSTTTSRFTAPVAGNYIFTWSGCNNGGIDCRIAIAVNGLAVMGQGSSGSGGTGDWQQTVITKLSVNDYVEVKCSLGTGTLYLAPAHTEFAGALLS